MRPLPRHTLLLLSAAALLVSACGGDEPAPDPHAAAIERLTRAVEDLGASNTALDAEVRRQARQLAALSRDRAAADREDAAGAAPGGEAPPMGATAETPAGFASADASADAPAGADAVGALLATEAGQKAIAEAAAREVERREAEERRLFVSYRIGMFAREARLDERQTDELQAIWKRSMDGGVALRKQFAAIGALPEAERESARAEAMQAMRDLGRQRRDAVAELLSGAQLEAYGEVDEEIVAGLHGAPRR